MLSCAARKPPSLAGMTADCDCENPLLPYARQIGCTEHREGKRAASVLWQASEPQVNHILAETRARMHVSNSMSTTR